jgi:hypothetical protein
MRLRFLLLLLSLVLFCPVRLFADWKQFNQDYASAVNTLNASDGCFYTYYLRDNPTWRVRMNVLLSGLCDPGCHSASGYGITFSWSSNGTNWYTAYCGEWYGNYADGVSSTLVKNYMGVYQPDRQFTISQNGCNYDASFTVERGDSDSLSGFDNSLISGMNNDIISQGRLVGIKEINGGLGYQYVYVDMCSGELYWVCNGICDGVVDPLVTWDGQPTPTPTQPTPTPSQATPTPPVLTPTPSQATPTPPVLTPTPFQATPTPPQVPGYTPAPPVVYSTPVYSSTVVPTPDNDGTVIDSNIDDIEYNSQVPDEGQDLTEDDTWLDTIFDLFSNHPLVDVIRDSGITTSGELCSLSVNLYGSVIEISFCDLVDYVEIFGYFVTVCASIYAYFIIFKAS